jgi:hypothetical protein
VKLICDEYEVEELAAWMKRLDKRPDFISAGFEERCRTANATCE